MEKRQDHRSQAAALYRRMYGTRRWRKRRAQQLAAEPLCRMCAAQQLVTVATVADHVTPHRGDLALFWEGDLQSLCATHHDGAKAKQEATGILVGCDTGGEPLDPSHPWHQAQTRH
jgi:5-methylcytosine-specific restriction protein A